MPNPLTKEQRKHLADVTQDARDLAEEAARAALENLAVHEGKYRGHMDDAKRSLRNRLRARGRALGDRLDKQSNNQGIDELAEAAAYEHWHRLLFTRFLAENGLLHTDEALGNVPVTLAECEELAPELGAEDGFELACRFAARTLPGVFRADDPVLELKLAPNHAVGLRRLLDRLPPETFRADDALGWTYQFWQAKRKKQINESGVKIGAKELPAVTQLFTEDYMVEFLLHNSLGAWWAGKEPGRLGPSTNTEEDARQAVSLKPRDGLPGIQWTYLRFIRSGAVPAPVGEDSGRDGPAPREDLGRDGPAPFVNPFADIDITKNQLPHWQQGDCWIFVTWRLADSVPAEKLRQWHDEKAAWLKAHPEPRSEADTREFHARYSTAIEDWLDAGHGSCLLRNPDARRIVVDALRFFAGQRYELGHWVVMPNHVHVLFRPLASHRLPLSFTPGRALPPSKSTSCSAAAALYGRKTTGTASFATTGISPRCSNTSPATPKRPASRCTSGVGPSRPRWEKTWAGTASVQENPRAGTARLPGLHGDRPPAPSTAGRSVPPRSPCSTPAWAAAIFWSSRCPSSPGCGWKRKT
jgi:hypothetical protein